MDRRACLLLPVAAAARPLAAQAPVRVRVVSESWAWLIRTEAQGRAVGPIAEFIRRMNAVQARYLFELQVVPRLRVDLMFEAGQADVFPLRTVLWTKPSMKLRATRTLIKTGDLYIARADNRYGGAQVFEQVGTRQLAGVRGYHYGVFGNNPDPDFIRQRYRVQLLPSNEAVLDFVRLGRAEVGIVPEAIVRYALQDPKLRETLIVSAQYDSQVELSHLVRDGGPISVAAMNEVVDLLERAGDVRRLRELLSLKR